MSSCPLISHHLFVAAAKEKNCVAPDSDRTEGPPSVSEIRVREIRFELVDFGRPLPAEAVAPLGALPRRGSG